MYTYVFKGINGKINAPWLSDMSQVKTEQVQTPTKITMRATYPNGVVLDIEQTAAQTTIYSNRPLTKNLDGSYSIPE